MNHNNTFSNQTLVKPSSMSLGFKINLRAINNFLITGIVVSFVAFLISNNDLAVKSFVLKDLKANLSETVWQNKELEVKVTTISSYQYLSQKVGELKFVPATDAKYLSANNQVFARR